MKIMYVNCGVKNYSELRSSRLYTQLLQSVCSYEKKNFIIILSRVYNEFLSGFLFATAKVAYITAMIFIYYNCSRLLSLSVDASKPFGDPYSFLKLNLDVRILSLNLTLNKTQRTNSY